MPPFGTSTTSRREGRVTKYPYCFKPHSLLNIIFRYADPSKGDRTQVPLRCSKCSGADYVIDPTPRYEISTGVYLPYLRMRCYNCSPNHTALFIPVDTRMPFKTSEVFSTPVKTLEYRHITKGHGVRISGRSGSDELTFAQSEGPLSRVPMPTQQPESSPCGTCRQPPKVARGSSTFQ